MSDFFIIKKGFLATAIMLFLLQQINAQSSLDLLTISGRYGIPQTAGAPVVGQNRAFGSLINLRIPIVFSDKTIWYNEVTYVVSNVENEKELASDIANPVVIHGFMLQTGIVQTLNEKQKLQLLIVPRFMTDFENISKSNWQLGGVALFENRYSESLMLRYGLFFNNELFGPSLTPLLHVDYTFAPKWSIVGMLPIFAKIQYQASANFSTGVSHFAFVTTYRLGNANYLNDYIERTSIDLTLFARQRLIGNLHFEARFGYALGRKYTQYAQDQKVDFRFILFNFGEERVVKNQLMKGGLIANVRLVYNLPMD